MSNDVVALPSRNPQDDEATEVAGQEDAAGTTESVPQFQQDTPAVTPAMADDGSTTQSSNDAVVTPSASIKPAATTSHARRDTRTAIPIVPAVPIMAGNRPKPVTPTQNDKPIEQIVTTREQTSNADEPALEESNGTATTPSSKTVPKSWADLVRSKNSAAATISADNAVQPLNGSQHSRAGSLAEVLSQHRVELDEKKGFLEPRGLVNTGNMCYMNSVRCVASRNKAQNCLLTRIL